MTVVVVTAIGLDIWLGETSLPEDFRFLGVVGVRGMEELK